MNSVKKNNFIHQLTGTDEGKYKNLGYDKDNEKSPFNFDSFHSFVICNRK